MVFYQDKKKGQQKLPSYQRRLEVIHIISEQVAVIFILLRVIFLVLICAALGLGIGRLVKSYVEVYHLSVSVNGQLNLIAHLALVLYNIKLAKCAYRCIVYADDDIVCLNACLFSTASLSYKKFHKQLF